MKLVRSKAFSGIIFIAFCLLFSYQFLIFAQQLETKFPAELQELLQGKSSDFTAAASQLKETDLPAALAVIELLKFKALHQEIPASIDQINNFESRIKSKLKNSSVISFSKTETCRKKVEATEIKVAGQKIAIPEYYIAEVGLAISGVIPTGETGTVFPDLQINIYSQAALAKYSLLIDGKAVPNNKISLFKDSDELGLIFKPDLNADSILAIGTHTAEISITNADGEKAEKQWSFTVGVYDVPTLPLPEDTKIIKELPIESEKILPGQKINGRLSVVIYQDKVGKKYTLYKLRTSSGQIITSQNLAFIGRKLIVDRDDPDEVTISPKTHLAFVGNKFNFSYTYVGSGKVLSDRWHIRNGGSESTESSVTMAGDIDVSCILMIEKSGVDTDGNPVSYQYEISETRHIGRVSVTERIFHDRRMLISNELSGSIPVEGEVWLWLDNKVHEGKIYTLETGELTVDKLRWKVQAAQGSPTIKNPVATMTQILFSEHGFAELVFDIKMTYRESGESYESNFKPEVSGLYAFYPVEGKAVFRQFPRGQISIGRRHLKLKSFEFTIKKQKRFISSPSDFELSEPLLICESAIWPASSPIKITKALPVISKGHSNKFLGTVDPFTFITPMAIDEDEIPLSLFGRFFFDQEASLVNPTLISDLESIPVFEAEDLIELQLSPSELITIQEGQQAEFEAQLAPVYDYGTGLYSATDKSLNILDGYTISSVENIFWFEEPLWGDDEEEDWKKKAASTLDFLHVFDPFVGVGSYSMNCGFVMNIQESDTKYEVSAFIVNSTPVNVLPGLRILSPIDKLAYPLNQTINVTTTLDSEEYLDQWQSIKWKLNGKEFNPVVEKPPFKITLDHVGKWKLEAELKTKDPNTNEEIILKDSAEFEVKPLEISISPRRKVFDFNKQQDAEINISVLVNGDEIEKPGEPVPWQNEDLQLVVDSVAWKLVTAPENCADCNFDDQSFKADCQFANTGAATTLATLTVRILGAEKLFNKKHKGFNDKFEEQIFEIPAGRADLWAVQMGEIANIENHFPEKSIAKAYRTYQVRSFDFEFNSNDKNKHSFSDKEGLKPEISLSPALPGISPVTASIDFKWQASPEDIIAQNLVEPTKMVIKPSEPCDYKIEAQPILDFRSSRLKMGKITTNANAVDLFSLIEASVAPSSFTMTLGETKILKYQIRSLESTPPPPPVITTSQTDPDDKSFLYLMNEDFILAIDNVEWSVNQYPAKTTIEGNSLLFKPSVIGEVQGSAKGYLRVREVEFDGKIAEFSINVDWACQVAEIILRILVNDKPVETSDIFHLGEFISCSYEAFKPDGSLIYIQQAKWSVENPALALFSEVTWKPYYLNDESLQKPSVEFTLFTFDQEKNSQKVSLTITYLGIEKKETIYIPFLRPKCNGSRPVTTPPDVYEDNGRLWLGIIPPTTHGFQLNPVVSNTTSKNYDFITVQIFQNYHTRFSESAQNEAIISKPIGSWYGDGHPPYGDAPNIPNGENIVLTGILNDSPGVRLDGYDFEILECNASATYSVFLMARPIMNNDDAPSSWCPIGQFHWGFSVSAQYTDSTWVKTPNSATFWGPIQVPPTTFPSWVKIETAGEAQWQPYRP